MASRFEMYEDGEEGWRWRLVDGNGVTLANSPESFSSPVTCRKQIQHVRQSAFNAVLEEPSERGPHSGPRRGRPSHKPAPGPKTGLSTKNPFNAAA